MRVRGLLVDLDGTLYVGDEPVGALKTVSHPLGRRVAGFDDGAAHFDKGQQNEADEEEDDQ
jgi:hypothetical protein